LPQSEKISSVITVYDFTYEYFSSGVRQLIHTAQKFKAIREATAVVCISENTRNDLLELVPGVDPDKVRVIHLAAGDSFFPLTAQSDPGHHRPIVLYIGSRVWYKNFEAAVESLTSLKDLELVCVGGGEFTESERKILERSIPGRYRHEGFINDERLNHLYNTAVCLLYPSTYEGFGIPVLEAMRAGCPVVALNMSSIPEVAGDAAILLDAAEPDLLAQAIGSVLDHDVRMEIRQKGLVQAQSFSWDHTVNQTIKVYEEVLGYALPRNVDKESVFE
jgi:mannosyltransferase